MLRAGGPVRVGTGAGELRKLPVRNHSPRNSYRNGTDPLRQAPGSKPATLTVCQRIRQRAYCEKVQVATKVRHVGPRSLTWHAVCLQLPRLAEGKHTNEARGGNPHGKRGRGLPRLRDAKARPSRAPGGQRREGLGAGLATGWRSGAARLSSSASSCGDLAAGHLFIGADVSISGGA